MTIFEKTQKGQSAYSLPKSDPHFDRFHPPSAHIRKDPIRLPEVSELDLTRHFNALAKNNVGIDTTFYPLGSCTMKFNPRVNEWAAALPGFTRVHPLAPDEEVQGHLQIIWELIQELCKISGMVDGTLLPNAGAQGEFTGVQMIAAYHEKASDTKRTQMIIPDSAHGTNPATAAMAGFDIVTVGTDEKGDIDLKELKSLVSEKTAGLMLTNPNTLGLFSSSIQEIAKIIHEAGGLLYYDGANLNPLLYVASPGAMGFDVMHINLHKTFSTPHGGGGPGSGPVLCNERLVQFLPAPRVMKAGDWYRVDWKGAPSSIGQIASFHGNFGIYLRAYLYIKLHGHFGLRRIAEQAVLNANYLKTFLSALFKAPYPQYCMHEFVLQADRFTSKGIYALDIAKRLLDFGVYAPTIYFPLIVKECLLIEPGESESKATLDRFIEIMQTIVEECENDPDLVKSSPQTLSVTRLDAVQAAKTPVLINSILT